MLSHPGNVFVGGLSTQVFCTPVMVTVARSFDAPIKGVYYIPLSPYPMVLPTGVLFVAHSHARRLLRFQHLHALGVAVP